MYTKRKKPGDKTQQSGDKTHNGSIVSGHVDELLGGYIEGWKKNSNFNVTLGSSLDPGFPSLSKVTGTVRSQDGSLKEDSYTNSMCLESWGRSNYARILIEIDVCNDFGDNLVMAVPNLEGTGYTKEIIRVEHEWKPPRCSTCFIFGHLLDHFPKSPTRVMNKMDKRGEPKMNQFVGKRNVLTLGNDTFSLSNSFKALNVGNSVSEEVETGNKASTSGVQEEGQSSTSLVEKINMFEKQLREGECG
uniref:Zinc knuckle CX2CX4HX4C n=1 Tax=Tanacetum cinerariifolium TaxID=118510 RepID=A0A6L2JKS1_TANCI|nr:hypothetical protein [Tanacetum cinerariifolium]